MECAGGVVVVCRRALLFRGAGSIVEIRTQVQNVGTSGDASHVGRSDSGRERIRRGGNERTTHTVEVQSRVVFLLRTVGGSAKDNPFWRK